MQNESEKKEKPKKKSAKKNLERNSIKKSTISLSEIPNIIKDDLNSDISPKKSVTNSFLDDKAMLYPTKLKSSFIKAPIKYKDETPSSLVELKKIFELENEIKKENKSIMKKEKYNKAMSTKKINAENEIRQIRNKIKSTRLKNNLELFKNSGKDNNDNDKDFIKKTKTRKSGFASIVKRNSNFFGITDSPVKKAKRKSIISQPNVSPTKIYTTEIFKKFFSKKGSFEEKEKEKRNEDKIYINIPNKEELLITVNTAQETINNYYEYMRECFQIIDLNFNKTIKLQPIKPVNFHFMPDKKTVVFELESTLVSYYIEDLNLDNEKSNSLGINIRPHLIECLDLIKNDYNIVIYSSGSKNYVDAILDFIDPKHEYFNFRLYREHCNKYIINNKIYFTKNLNIFKNICQLKDIVMVDCSVIGFGFFLENGIPIIPYYDSKEDAELMLLSYYLLSISSNNDLRIALKRDMELDYYFEEARKKNNENENNISNNLIKESELISPEPEEKHRKRESKTYKFSNYIHISKRNSHSFEDKKDKNKITHRGCKKKKKIEKEEDIKYKSPQKDKEKESLFKKKNTARKERARTQQKNIMYLKSPQVSSKEKGKKAEIRKNLDKNK